MSLLSRTLLAAVLLLAACGLRPGPSQSTRDAQLIVASITPVARSVASYGAAPATAAEVDRMLASATEDATVMANEGIPGLLETQAFLEAAQPLLLTLGNVAGLPPDAAGVVQAALALLPSFADAVNAPLAATPRMSADQARLILRGSTVVAPPVVAAPAPAPAPVAAAPPSSNAPRFHLSVDDVDGRLNFQFLDRGQVIETGVADSFRSLEARYAAFKKLRQAQ